MFLFFGLSGFLASRPELFASDVQHLIPENITLEQGELSGYLKSRPPSGAVLMEYAQQDDFAEAQFEDDEGGQFDVEISLEDRSYRVAESYALPSNSESMTALQLANVLAKDMTGKLDEGSVAEDGNQFWFNLESVWAVTMVEVDRAAKRYEIQQDRAPWAAALVQLRRGKQSGPFQRVLIDLTAIFMVVATLTGILLGVRSRNPVVRNVALILVGISIALTVLMIMGR